MCLSLAPTDGSNWKCGDPYEYCGFVAPNQIITDMKLYRSSLAARQSFGSRQSLGERLIA